MSRIGVATFKVIGYGECGEASKLPGLSVRGGLGVRGGIKWLLDTPRYTLVERGELVNHHLKVSKSILAYIIRGQYLGSRATNHVSLDAVPTSERDMIQCHV